MRFISKNPLASRRIVTLLPEPMAKQGLKFVHEGGSRLCEDCRLYKVCIGVLEKGRVYEVVRVRDKKHQCKLIDGIVRIVEVVEPCIEALIPSNLGVENITFTFKPINCSECKYFKLCSPEGLKAGDKVKVEKVYEKIRCMRGRPLVRASLKRIP